ncbi:MULTISPECIES: hypothetical protein [unclassified Thioalkalivibrio]|uniref:hypothetical protein n=1 Tax=unclassified Thioalkalivibrio TaxID=2621013 RepID=UPI000364700E|nr:MULTISPECIES: hypothetical protein [unclassified Thioalkalivibrio]
MTDMDDQYELYLDYQRGAGDPARIFHVTGGMIDALSALDKDLASVISASCIPHVELSDIEVSSLRTKLRNFLEDLPDEALKNVDVRRLVGHFLIKAKYAVIRWCEDKESIDDINEVRSLEEQIENLAHETDIKQLPAYSPIDRRSLLHHINSITNILRYLGEHDKLEYRSRFGSAYFNRNLGISADAIMDILTRELVTSREVAILKVKKPDYLGHSKWSVLKDGHPIDVRIADEYWLSEFQIGKVALQPGDSIRVTLRHDVAYGHNNEVVHVWYEVEDVHEVLPGPGRSQSVLF